MRTRYLAQLGMPRVAVGWARLLVARSLGCVVLRACCAAALEHSPHPTPTLPHLPCLVSPRLCRDYIISGSEAALKKADALAAPPEPAGADGAAPSGTPADSGEV